MMDWWCQKGIDGFRMDVISMISKDQAFPDGAVKENGYGDFSPFVRNGPRVHEFLREMNREVLAKYDLLTVGECSGVTVEEAKKYANEDGTELDMVFQFEHMDLDGGETFKWNDRKIDLVELKEVLSRWQRELDGKAWNSLYWCNHDQPRGRGNLTARRGTVFTGATTISQGSCQGWGAWIRRTGRFPRKCWLPAST